MTTTTPYITDAQLEQFQEEGYLILENAFSDDEVRRMRTEADHILELVINSSLCNGRRSHRLDWIRQPGGPQVVRKIQPINDLSLYLAQVSNDPRLIEPMRAIMGQEPILMEEKLNYKEPLPEPVAGIHIAERTDHFPVHHDWAYYRAQGYPQSILSSAISLDPSTSENGCLRVWPGSHKTCLESQSADVGLEVKPELIDHGGGQDVVAPAGSVMLFHSLLVHNSRPNTSGRPRRIMIYSHCPADANEGYPDRRNGLQRLKESPWERQYFRKRLAGQFTDAFKAPVFEGLENAGDFWIEPAEK